MYSSSHPIHGNCLRSTDRQFRISIARSYRLANSDQDKLRQLIACSKKAKASIYVIFPVPYFLKAGSRCCKLTHTITIVERFYWFILCVKMLELGFMLNNLIEARAVRPGGKVLYDAYLSRICSNNFDGDTYR